MASLLHEAILALLAAHPEVVLRALHEPLGDLPGDLELRLGEPSTGEASPQRLALELRRRGEAKPVAVLTVEVQLSKDEGRPRAWLLDHAEWHERLRVPAYLVVVAHDPAVAAWAAGPFGFGMLTMRPRVLTPVELLEARGISLDPPLRQRIAACADLDGLAQWLRRAATTTVAAEVFAP